MNEINGIVYKENDNIRTILSENFSFVLDKDSGINLCWGKTKDDDPLYDPLSPQNIEIILNDLFQFDKNVFDDLLNCNLKNDNIYIKDNYILSTVSNVFLDISHCNCISNDIKDLINYLTFLKLNIVLDINYSNDINLRYLMKLKILNIESIYLNVLNIDEKLNEIIKLFISKNISLNCKVHVNNKNFNDFLEFLSKASILVPFNIIFDEKITKTNFKKLEEAIANRKLINCFINNDLKNIGKKYENIPSKEYESSLFSCIYDFIDDIIYFDEKTKDKLYFNIDEIHNITDFWNDKKTISNRNRLLKKLNK